MCVYERMLFVQLIFWLIYYVIPIGGFDMFLKLRSNILLSTCFCSVTFDWITTKNSDTFSCEIQIYISLDDVRLYAACNAPIWDKLQKCFEIFIGEVYHRIYVRKSRFTAPLARRHKLNFWLYISPNENFEYSYPLIAMPCWYNVAFVSFLVLIWGRERSGSFTYHILNHY